MNLDFSKVGKKDPCPCGSGKKFKRCHGASTEETAVSAGDDAAASVMGNGAQSAGGFDPSNFDMNSLDPAWMMSFANALQRLPKGQVQKLQAIMQKAMSGKDVTREAEALERTLPAEFKSLIDSFKPPAAAEAGAADSANAGLATSGAEAMANPEAAEAKTKFSKVWNRIFKR